MIPWLLEVFDYPVVFVLRNPHAVVASQRAMGWRSKLDRYLSQEQLVDIHLSKQLEMLQGIDTGDREVGGDLVHPKQGGAQLGWT